MEPTGEQGKRPILTSDPGRQYAADCERVDGAIRRVLESGRYVLGEAGASFERAFADYLGVAGCVGTASGTDALEIALRAVGVGPGDEVVTPALTSSATATAVVRAGALPVFADVEDETLTLDPESVRTVLSDRTRAILPVHLYGHPCDVEKLSALAREHHLRRVDDCAQSHGARVGGGSAGAAADASAYSFYPTKNLGALGDGGAVASNREDVLDRARRLREYGWRERQVSEEIGLNSRLDEIQAAVLAVRLESLDVRNVRRREIASIYGRELRESGLRLPVEREGIRAVYHQYVVRLEDREGLRLHLATRDVSAGVLYPRPLHRHPAFAGFRRAADLGRSESAAARLLCLPVHPDLEDEEVEAVVEAVRSFPGA